MGVLGDKQGMRALRQRHESPAPGVGAESDGDRAPVGGGTGRAQRRHDVPYVQCTNASALAELTTIFPIYRSVPALPSSFEESRRLGSLLAEEPFSCPSNSSRSAASAFFWSSFVSSAGTLL